MQQQATPRQRPDVNLIQTVQAYPATAEKFYFFKVLRLEWALCPPGGIKRKDPSRGSIRLQDNCSPKMPFCQGYRLILPKLGLVFWLGWNSIQSMRKPLIAPGPLLIVIAALLWAADGVLRRSLYVLHPITIVFLEHFVGLFFLSPFLISSLKQFKTLRSSDKTWILWVALFSSVLGTLWFTTALLATQYIPFSVVFLLQKLQPIFVIAAAAVFLREKITRKYLAFACLALIAAFFVTFPNGRIIFASGGNLRAAFFALAAAFAWGTSTVFSRMMLAKLPDRAVTTLRFFFATLMSGILLVFMRQAPSLTTVTNSQLATFVIIALSTGMLALYIYYKGLARTPAIISTILELIFPVSAVLIDVILYKSVLLPSQYLAAIVLLFAAYKLGSMRKNKAKFTTTQIKGKGLGKKLGYPTINMAIPRELDVQTGIYAAKVWVGKMVYMGALHFGPIPTFADDKNSLEIFLLDVNRRSEKKIDNKTYNVELVQWLRPVMKFESPKALVAQITKDVASIRSILSRT